ncbi:hypothetical protein HmCmsJML281_02251 [Escherichia coli]|nr:hypothetical protein HmCmsJML281_02251 [Escherichia coli]
MDSVFSPTAFFDRRVKRSSSVSCGCTTMVMHNRVPSGNVSIRAFTVFSPLAFSPVSVPASGGVRSFSTTTAACGSPSSHHTPFSGSDTGGVNQRLSAKSVITGIMPSGVSCGASRVARRYSVSLSTHSGRGLNSLSSQPCTCRPFIRVQRTPAPPSAPTTRSHTWFSIATGGIGSWLFFPIRRYTTIRVRRC